LSAGAALQRRQPRANHRQPRANHRQPRQRKWAVRLSLWRFDRRPRAHHRQRLQQSSHTGAAVSRRRPARLALSKLDKAGCTCPSCDAGRAYRVHASDPPVLLMRVRLHMHMTSWLLPCPCSGVSAPAAVNAFILHARQNKAAPTAAHTFASACTSSGE